MIAVIDDDSATCQSIQRLLKVHGLESKTFLSGKEFLGSKHFPEIRCLILDVRMPEMTGLQLHQHLVKSGIHIPTIYVTGFVDDEVQNCVFHYDTVAVLEKPFDSEQLMAGVKSALQK